MAFMGNSKLLNYIWDSEIILLILKVSDYQELRIEQNMYL